MNTDEFVAACSEREGCQTDATSRHVLTAEVGFTAAVCQGRSVDSCFRNPYFIHASKTHHVICCGKGRMKHHKKWVRFSLRELLLLVGAVTVVLAVLVRPHRQRQAVDSVRRLGGDVEHFFWGDKRSPVTDPDPAWIRNLMGEQFMTVGVVNLDGSNATDSDLDFLRTLRDIRVLNLSNTEITGEGLQCLRNHAQLRIIRLNNTGVGDDVLNEVAKMTALQELYLNGTRVSDNGLQRLRKLQHVRVLAIDNTNVTARTVDWLRHWPKLELLQVMGVDLYQRDLDDADAIRRKFQLVLKTDAVVDEELNQKIVNAWSGVRVTFVRSRLFGMVARPRIERRPRSMGSW